MTDLGILIAWSSTQTKAELKKEMIKDFLKEYKDLEDFLNQNIRKIKSINGYSIN